MRTLLHKIFIEHWQRKLIAVILSVYIWYSVNRSLIDTHSIASIPIRVINIPPGKTIVDLQNNGTLGSRVSLTLTGNKKLLNELTCNDLEVVIDAQNRKEDWIADISRRNLTSLNPEINLNKTISHVVPTTRFIQMTKLVSDKIPIYITQPIGEAPKGYQFRDIWPYQLSLNVSGPEELVKRLKSRGVRLTFDLNDISKAQLDALRSRPDSTHGDEIAFFVPDQWKRVSIPLLSDAPIEIDDPRTKDLRIDFIQVSLIPIQARIPISLYFPTEGIQSYNPKNISWGNTPLVELVKGVHLFSQPLYAKGVTKAFVQTVQQMIQLSITVDLSKENQSLPWSIEFINPRLLEDRYVSLMMSDISDEEVRELQPLVREEYLRNRFRSYMNRFQLYKSDDKRLELEVRLESNKVMIEEGSPSLQNSPFFIKE